ncbi:MAG: GNAT family N-acetyltransferase [Bacteroidetes bacterium]|nr:MAG: GNAT family N-acetyltransferase [Bacteroidota bacterium]
MATKKKSNNHETQNVSFEIFEAQSFDLKALAGLFDAYRQFYRQPTDKDGAMKFLRERLSEKDSVIFIAFDENSKAVGFTQLYPLFSSVGMKKTWLLNDLFVDPAFRGKGISKLLIEKTKEHARITQANGIHLETEKSNLIGLKLYPSAGFVLNDNSNFYFWALADS